MPITINVNGLTLCHRASEGISRNTLPDVCKTPPKGIPRPFSNTAYSKDLAKGTTTVLADGGNMIANFGSIFARSTGDEGGSMGGVASGTHLAEADFITHSFDVFFEGRPACRLTDKMFMNHRNTVNMSGLDQEELQALRKAIQKMVCECNDEVKPAADDNCMTLGNKKHDCVESKKDAENKKNQAEGRKSRHGGEKGYQVDDTGKVARENGKPKVDDIAGRRAQRVAKIDNARGALNTANRTLGTARGKMTDFHNARSATSGSRGRAKGGGTGIRGMLGEMLGQSIAEGFVLPRMEAALNEALAAAEKQAAQAATDLAKAEAEKIMRRQGFRYPDGTLLNDDGKIGEMSEYKFPCPKGVPTGGKNQQGVPSVSRGNGRGDWTKGQKDSYQDILDDLIAGGEAAPTAELKKYNTQAC